VSSVCSLQVIDDKLHFPFQDLFRTRAPPPATFPDSAPFAPPIPLLSKSLEFPDFRAKVRSLSRFCALISPFPWVLLALRIEKL